MRLVDATALMESINLCSDCAYEGQKDGRCNYCERGYNDAVMKSVNLCSELLAPKEEKPREVKATYVGIGGKAVKIFDRNWVKSELKPQICTCCLAPLPAHSNTCEYCGITYR